MMPTFRTPQMPVVPCRRVIRLGLLAAVLAACGFGDEPGDEPPPAAGPPEARSDTLPTAYAAVREFCAVPAEPPGFPRPPRARLLPRHPADATSLSDAEIELPLRCVIRAEAQRERLWTLVSARTALAAPGGDSMLVLASMGAQPTDGYGIAIDSVWVVADTATVSVTRWSAGCEGGAIMTYPAMALHLPSAKFVRFRETVDPGEPCE